MFQSNDKLDLPKPDQKHDCFGIDQFACDTICRTTKIRSHLNFVFSVLLLLFYRHRALQVAPEPTVALRPPGNVISFTMHYPLLLMNIVCSPRLFPTLQINVIDF